MMREERYNSKPFIYKIVLYQWIWRQTKLYFGATILESPILVYIMTFAYTDGEVWNAQRVDGGKRDNRIAVIGFRLLYSPRRKKTGQKITQKAEIEWNRWIWKEDRSKDWKNPEKFHLQRSRNRVSPKKNTIITMGYHHDGVYGIS